MHLMTGTRIDIAYFLREVSQFLANPECAHWSAAVLGFKYLKGTHNHGILLGGQDGVEQLHVGEYLLAYTDSDYAQCKDTRRCIGGYVTMLYSSPIIWVSRKHHTTALSTTEAEYITLCYCMQELIFLRLLLNEMDFENNKSTLMYEDNQNSIKICNNTQLKSRAKGVPHSILQPKRHER